MVVGKHGGLLSVKKCSILDHTTFERLCQTSGGRGPAIRQTRLSAKIRFEVYGRVQLRADFFTI